MSDMAMLRGLKTLFGPVASTTTLWQTLNRIGPGELRDLTTAEAEARTAAWALEAQRSQVVIDIDATIVTCRSDKQDAHVGEPLVEPLHDLIRSLYPGLGCGQLDGQRDPVQPLSDRGHRLSISFRVRDAAHRAGPLEEQLLSAVKSRNPKYILALQSQGFPARR